MPSIHPGAFTPVEQVKALFGKLADRMRAVEARTPKTFPLVAVQSRTATTTSATATSLWWFFDASPEEWAVTIQVTVGLSVPAAKAGLTLVGPGNQRLDSTAVTDGAPITLRGAGSAGPFNLTGFVSSGTLSVTFISATATPWSVLTDADE